MQKCVLDLKISQEKIVCKLPCELQPYVAPLDLLKDNFHV